MLQTIIQIGGILTIITTVIGYFYKIEKRFARLENKIDKIELESKRNTIISLINFCPDNNVAIMKAYDEYKALGGNSYIDDIFYQWKSGHETKML